jgi:hypothetical protein
MLWFFKIFSPKNSANKLAFLTQNNSKLCKILIVTLVFVKNANFFAKNCRKSQKILIITSTPESVLENSFRRYLRSQLQLGQIIRFSFKLILCRSTNSGLGGVVSTVLSGDWSYRKCERIGLFFKSSVQEPILSRKL